MKMALQINMRTKKETDELAILRRFMKLMLCWPVNQTKWKRIMSVVLLMPFSMMVCLSILFIIINIKREDPLILLQCTSDFIGIASILFRGFYIRHYANTVVDVSNKLIEFKELEKGHVPIRIKIPRLVWWPGIFHGLVVVSSFALCVLAYSAPGGARQLSIRIPSFIIQTDLIFYPLVTAFAFGHYGIFLSNISGESVIICLTNTLCEKAQTLIKIFGELAKLKDIATRNGELNKAIIYHNKIIELHAQTEKLISKPMLPHLLFLMLAVGTPALKILLVEIDNSSLVFLMCYLCWVPGQLMVYFLMCDAATTTAQDIGYAAYSAYNPNMTKDEVRKLVFLMAKAFHPMHLTARKIIQINRHTLLQVIKKSYSIYSFILRLR